MLQQTITAATWPIPGDVPDLDAIIAAQAETIEQQAVLIDAYQGNLNAAQNPIPGTAVTASGIASGSPATQLQLSTVVGTVVTGSTVADAGATTTIPAGTVILGQISGTVGGAGIYLTNNATTASGTALTITPPPAPSSWPTPQDAPTLTLIQQQQTAVLRMQSSLIQAYQDLLNTSQTPAPPTGP